MTRTTRRSFLGQASAGGLMVVSGSAWGQAAVDLPFAPSERALTKGFPQKGPMILQRTRPPLLETPFEVFDRGVFTHNDSFYVRWHWAVIPTEIDVGTFRLSVRGHVDKELSLTLKEIVDGLPRVELAAVNQCSGNSRGFTEPRVPGAQWANGAMGNAKWMGVRLKDVLDRAGVKAGATAVRFAGLDDPVVPEAPKFMKSLALDHASDGEVMIAYAMNGEQLPLLNGFPLRLVVPGWYSTYWVKMLARIEVLAAPDENFWTRNAYLIPDTPGADMKPGQTGLTMVPITRMVPRSFVTNLKDGATLKAGTKTLVRGIAFGGDTGVKSVELSVDGGKSWLPTVLGRDEGKYSFRQWQAEVTPSAGDVALMVRCTNDGGLVQPMANNWNPSGFMHNGIETVHLKAA
ncbi:molybdopterin-dependent oxidoreductase [Reyranella sp.]|jgi:DMSO/TMAO reductase YedYZ molybdopterin-dependent catalytic subunit|uniref:molybdopterin-dependent oxidoreductase n=2 Tax=Reyranella sp. TaxID=1929291 RepID=UPI00387E228D